jgi:hypothetical protein
MKNIKNQLTFENVNENTLVLLKKFQQARINLAKENEKYKKNKKPLNEKVKEVEEKRATLLATGMAIDEVTQKISRVEIDNQLRLLENEHKETIKPFNEIIKKAYTTTVPDELYNGYIKKITEDLNGVFLDNIRLFLTNLGLEKLRQGQVNRFANSIAPKIGAKIATDKSIVKNNGKLSDTYTKSQFKKIFLAVFVDSYMPVEKTETPTETEPVETKTTEAKKATKKSTKTKKVVTKKEEAEFLKLDKKEISETDLDIIHDTYPTITSKNLGVTDKGEDFEEVKLSLNDKTITVYVCLAD